MRRYFISIVALALVGVLAFALTGCGGGAESQAKDYMEAGDKIIAGLEQESEELESVLETIFTELTAGNVTSSQAVEEMRENLETASADAMTKAEQAEAEFEKILDLDDAEQYKEYAELRIAVIDGIVSLIDMTDNYLSSLGETLTDAEQGQQVDLNSVQAEAQKFFSDVLDLQEQITADGEEADAIKKDLQ